MRPAYGLVLATLVAAVLAEPVSAQAGRTWVSGVGDDANPCTRTAPCKTFAGAVSKTVTGGEISCLDPGGFGMVVLTKSMTLDCRGTAGSILMAGGGAPGSAGVIVNGAGAVVILRNMSIIGIANAPAGIRFLDGAALHLEHVDIAGFTADPAVGIDFTPSGAANLFVNDVTVANNASSSGGAAINIAPTAGGSAVASILNAKIHYNGPGMTLASDNGAISAVLRDSSIASSLQDGILATGGQAISLTVDNSAIINNVGSPINAMTASVWIGRSLIVGNGAGPGTGVLRSFRNNQIAGNADAGPTLDPVAEGALK
jgi:hypothetical protein